MISTRIYINTKESNSESISSDLIKKQDYWQLIYTYEKLRYDIETEVLHYYGCTKEFQCEYDSEYGDYITETGVDHIPVYSSEKKLVDLYFEDILQGFELGLESLEEIADAKDKYGEVEQLLFS